MNEVRESESPVLAGRYELGPLLGRGGMGSVRDARDLRLGRQVAVKILRPDLAEQTTARRRFETEAHAAARLTHPNVVMVFDSGEDNGAPFLVMERLPGQTLADELTDGPLPPERVRMVAREILAALAAAHSAGIIHRDIKPGNVLLTEDGHVKVSDFGIAKTVDDIDQTQTVELVASPGYLAPERLAGEPATPKSDLYSVGVLLYEALSGRRPFEGDTQSALMRAIEQGHAPPLTSLRSRLPADIITAVERAMSLDPSERFDSAHDMAAAIEPSVDLAETTTINALVEGTETVPIDFESRDGTTQALKMPVPVRTDPLQSDSPFRRRVLSVAVGAGLAAALLGAVVAYKSDPPHPTVPAVTPTTVRPPTPLENALHQLEQAVAG